ncbi:unknown [Lactococcus phage Q54]|uniref:Uncharacterized protein n=1 Tax=Lactococcus phage Q54 TaxID=382685 RepID=Q0GXV0_9CAUD|nr:hypothetical protein Q54_gp22 [Lactococcus phage Q54]ABF22576.1 unknown [Lactococcus phage Q54]
MTYNTVKEVITAAGLDPLLTYTNNGMWFTPVGATKWEGAADKGTPLTVAELTQTIQIPPSVYQTPGQLEVFKSNLIFSLATKVISSLFVTTSEVSDAAVKPMIPNATANSVTVTTATGAMDALLSHGIVDSFKAFNGNRATALEFSGTTYGTVFDNVIQIEDPKLVAFEAVRGAYMLYLNDVDFEIKKELHNNKIFLTGSILVQGMPTMAINTAVTA